MPGGKRFTTRKSVVGGGEWIESGELKNRIVQLTLGKESFGQLQGIDLCKAQFILANTHQGGPQANALDVERTMLAKTGLIFNDLRPDSMAEEINYGIDLTKDGGLKFTATRRRRFDQVADADMHTYQCDDIEPHR